MKAIAVISILALAGCCSEAPRATQPSANLDHPLATRLSPNEARKLGLEFAKKRGYKVEQYFDPGIGLQIRKGRLVWVMFAMAQGTGDGYVAIGSDFTVFIDDESGEIRLEGGA